MYIKNMRGPKAVPCGTPDLTWTYFFKSKSI